MQRGIDWLMSASGNVTRSRVQLRAGLGKVSDVSTPPPPPVLPRVLGGLGHVASPAPGVTAHHRLGSVRL